MLLIWDLNCHSLGLFPLYSQRPQKNHAACHCSNNFPSRWWSPVQPQPPRLRHMLFRLVRGLTTSAEGVISLLSFRHQLLQGYACHVWTVPYLAGLKKKQRRSAGQWRGETPAAWDRVCWAPDGFASDWFGCSWGWCTICKEEGSAGWWLLETLPLSAFNCAVFPFYCTCKQYLGARH